MIYISLKNGRTETLIRRDIYYSLPLIMPMVLEIGKVINSLNERHNINCNVHVKICDTINLEVKND